MNEKAMAHRRQCIAPSMKLVISLAVFIISFLVMFFIFAGMNDRKIPVWPYILIVMLDLIVYCGSFFFAIDNLRRLLKK